jgi:hypothetical protein
MVEVSYRDVYGEVPEDEKRAKLQKHIERRVGIRVKSGHKAAGLVRMEQ